jgi:DNA-binding transcriptional LysR family regulator
MGRWFVRPSPVLINLHGAALRQSLFLHDALQGMLMLAGIVHHLRHFGLGDLIGEDAAFADAVLVDAGTQSIEVVEGSYSQIVRNLHDGALDLIFGALRAPPPFDELIEEQLFEDPYTIVCRRDHPLTHLAQADAKDLAQYGWVHPTADLPRRSVLDHMTAAWGLNPNITFETNCLATITALLSASDRLSILSLRHLKIDQRLERVNHPPIEHEPRHVGLTIRKDWLPTPFQQRFVEHLRLFRES